MAGSVGKVRPSSAWYLQNTAHIFSNIVNFPQIISGRAGVFYSPPLSDVKLLRNKLQQHQQ